MKKISVASVVCLFAAFMLFGVSSEALANVFASDVRVVNPDGAAFDGNLQDGTPGVGIEFRLNEDATSVFITVMDSEGSTVASFNAGPQHVGVNLVVWSGLDDGGQPVPAGDYSFEVTAEDAVGHGGYDIVYAMEGTRVFTRGGTTIRNPAAPNFGHPIGGNGGGSGLKRGPLNFFADGTGFAFEEPGLSRYSPWDVRDVLGTTSAGRLFMLTSDDEGWLYYSDEIDPLSKMYRFASSLDPTTLKVVMTSGDSTKRGLGIEVIGTGADRVIYWGVANRVVRAAIGEAETFDPANFVVVAEFANDTTAGTNNPVFIRDIVIDDSGFLYVSLRRGTSPNGVNPGLAVEKYDISGALPVTRATRLWTIPVGFGNGNGQPVGFGIDRGDDRTSNVDDRVYFSNGAAAPPAGRPWNGIHKIDDLLTGGSTFIFEDFTGDGGTSSQADMAVDAAGNLIFFENSSEWLIALSPPDGPNSFTTPSAESITIATASAANAFPGIAAVTDVPNDQGYQVRVSWAGSALDRLGNVGQVAGYEVYRQVSAAASINAKQNHLSGPPGEWELVGATSARQTSNYHLVVPTLYNEAPDTTILSTFYVSAVGSDGSRWDSNPASGFSIDNLVPTAPTNLTATPGQDTAAEPTVALTWDESQDEDFNYFAVYRSTQSGFDPTTLSPIATLTGTEFTDSEVSNVSQTLYYRVVAYDFSGNQGEFSDEAVASIVTGVADRPDAQPTAFALHQNYPNPFNPTTKIDFDLAYNTEVTLRIFNMNGQLVKTLVDGERPQGHYSITWNATDENGLRLGSGVYLYVLKAGDFVQSKRLTLLK